MIGEVPAGYWEWFRKDGSKLRSGSFDDEGRQVGEWTPYDRTGEVYKVARKKAKRPWPGWSEVQSGNGSSSRP